MTADIVDFRARQHRTDGTVTGEDVLRAWARLTADHLSRGLGQMSADDPLRVAILRRSRRDTARWQGGRDGPYQRVASGNPRRDARRATGRSGARRTLRR